MASRTETRTSPRIGGFAVCSATALTRAPLALAVLATVALATPPAYALSSDREQPIEIEADRAEADERARVTIYRGDAVITQGTLRITGETVWIYFNENDEFVKLVSEGVNALRDEGRGFLVITHYQRLLDHIKPDVVHIMADGRIVKTGGPELALEVENNGYADILAEVN